MRFLIPVLCILSVAYQSALAVLTLSATERAQLERKAAKGDAEAAWRLYIHTDGTNGTVWLHRALELDHPQAQMSLAYDIKENGVSPKGFGATAPDAVKYLLLRAARTEGSACRDLASAFAEGYFGAVDQVRARFYFERGARFNHRMCWEKLSHYYSKGTGGHRNDDAAYYWISLEAQCVDPRSVGGKMTWTTREELAAKLSLTNLEHEWKRIDDFMAQVAAKKVTVYSAPFGSGSIDPKLEAEGRHIAKQSEEEHRKKWQSKKTTPPPQQDQ